MSVEKRVKAWSYSAYAQWAMCPLQYKLEKLDKIKLEESPAMARGNKLHKGIAAFVSNQVDTLPQEAMAHDATLQTMREIRDVPADKKQVEQQWGYTAAFAPTGWFGADTWFRSVLDAGVMYEDMTYECVDWKSGKRYGSNDDQMETQAIAVMARFKPVRHVTTRLAYFDQGTFEFAEFPVSHKQKLIDKWRDKVAPMFSDTIFAPRPNEKCRFCGFSRSKGGQCAFG